MKWRPCSSVTLHWIGQHVRALQGAPKCWNCLSLFHLGTLWSPIKDPTGTPSLVFGNRCPCRTVSSSSMSLSAVVSWELQWADDDNNRYISDNKSAILRRAECVTGLLQPPDHMLNLHLNTQQGWTSTHWCPALWKARQQSEADKWRNTEREREKSV